MSLDSPLEVFGGVSLTTSTVGPSTPPSFLDSTQATTHSGPVSGDRSQRPVVRPAAGSEKGHVHDPGAAFGDRSGGLRFSL